MSNQKEILVTIDVPSYNFRNKIIFEADIDEDLNKDLSIENISKYLREKQPRINTIVADIIIKKIVPIDKINMTIKLVE